MWLVWILLLAVVQGAHVDANVMRRDDHPEEKKHRPESEHSTSDSSVEVHASGEVEEQHPKTEAKPAKHKKDVKDTRHQHKHLHAKHRRAALEESPSLEGMLDASFLQTASGGAQEVMFGVYCRRVFDVDVLQKVWTGDLVLTISWNDPAAKKVIPEGQDETRLSSEDARNVMWLPDIGVTNRDFKNLEVISSSVKVWKDGRVTKVERLLATMTNDFDIKAYPYDQQTLEVLVASEKMMADEMVLKPHTDETVTGVKDAVLIGSGFSGMEGAKPNYTISTFEEADGMLVKSRGRFEIKIRRNAAAAGRQLFSPTFIILGVSYSVFFFPMVPAFAMPRVASGIISLLGMVTFMTKNKMPDSWTDVFLEAMCLQVGAVCILSLTMEISFHTFKNEDFAKQLNLQYKVGFPVVSALIYIILLACTSGDLNNICTYLVRSIVFVLMAGNLFRIYRRLNAGASAAPAAPDPPEGESK